MLWSLWTTFQCLNRVLGWIFNGFSVDFWALFFLVLMLLMFMLQGKLGLKISQDKLSYISVVSFSEQSVLPSDFKIRLTYIYCYKANKYCWNFQWNLLTFRQVDSVSSMSVVLEDLGSLHICNCSSRCIAINIKLFGGLADSFGSWL